LDVLWIPITVAAAAFQALRTALQKSLTGRLSTNGSTFVRFAFGAPLALIYAAVLIGGSAGPAPTPQAAFFAWLILGAAGQILATALLIRVLTFRNFPVGVAYTKTEAIQAAVFGLVFLGDAISPWSLGAIGVATVGVLLFSLVKTANPWRALIGGWLERPALYGIASGGLFGLSAIGYRGASLSLAMPEAFVPAAYTLAWATTLQTLVMALYLRWREPGQLTQVVIHWRPSALAGLMSVLGSACWFTAMTLQTAGLVRTLGLVELVFTYLLSLLWFKERAKPTEIAGIVLLLMGIAMLLNPS